MKHLVLTQFGTPSESVTLRDDPDPTPGPNDVLVRMEAAAVNPSDLLMRQGRYFARPEPPAPAGGEGVGIVVDTGAQADRALLGKRVVVLPIPGHNLKRRRRQPLPQVRGVAGRRATELPLTAGWLIAPVPGGLAAQARRRRGSSRGHRPAEDKSVLC